MVNTVAKPEFEELRPGVKAPAQETILTPASTPPILKRWRK
nr:hypothetical protein [Thermostichus lividus]